MFKYLNVKDKKIILDAVEVKQFKAGQNIIKQNDDGQELFILAEGRADCKKVFPGETKERYLKQYTPGEVFGELALLYNAPRAATIDAKTDCTLYSLERQTFNVIVKTAAIERRNKYESFLSNVEILKSLDQYERAKICDCL